LNKSLFILALLMLLLASKLGATVYFVSPSGSDSRSGTISDPWRSIAYASSVIRGGDTLYVRGGVYHEVLNPVRSGTADAYIVYSGYPGEFVQIDGPLDGRHTVVTQWKDYIVIQGFTIKDQDFLQAPGQSSYWVNLSGGHVIFRNNRLLGEGNAYTNVYTNNELSRGIVVDGHHVLVENCFVRGVSYGIVITGPSPRFDVLRFDTVYATCSSNVVVQSTGGQTTAYHGTLIEQCVLDTSWMEDNIQFEHEYTNPTSTLCNRGTIVRGNRCGNAAENAIDMKGTERVVIENNSMYSASGDDDGPLYGHDFGSGSGLTAKSPNTPSRKTLVRFNVIYDNMSGITMTEGDVCYNNTILNNRRTWKGPNQEEVFLFGVIAWSEPGGEKIFMNNILAGQPNRAMCDFSLDGTGAPFALDNNLYYDGVSNAKFYHRVSGNFVTTDGIASWKSLLGSYSGYSGMLGKDVHSVEADPRFVNAPLDPVGFTPAWDFGLQAMSPAIDAGREVASAQNSAANSRILQVDNAYCFNDGFGITGGDMIRIGRGPAVQITSINEAAGTVTLAEPRSWTAGAGVHVAFQGNAPDIGAVESSWSRTTSQQDGGQIGTFALQQNYPNPFNPSSDIRYQISDISRVQLAVYDLLGREVAMLVNEQQAPGAYQVRFDATGLPSGMYLYRLTAGSFAETKRMMLMK
jgi:hypothetical protein